MKELQMRRAPTLVGRVLAATLALERAEERARHGDDDALRERVKVRVLATEERELEGLEQELAGKLRELVELVQVLVELVQELVKVEREQGGTDQEPVVDEPVQRHGDEAQAAKALVQVQLHGNEVQVTRAREPVELHGSVLVATPAELNQSGPVWLSAVQKDAKA
uniref:Chaperone protein ClpB 1 n=1 Tax=Zeugodacus cucurbitae TaxID=28588 RepID=A0A0A1X6C2_ZEUCU